MKNPLIVTIDGPAGVGKSTIARQVAKTLGIAYLDTGAMFRVLALHLGPDAETLPEEELARRMAECSFSLSGTGIKTSLSCNGRVVGNEIRTEEAGMLAARIGMLAPVREYLKKTQQEIGIRFSLVAEGRDMGTVVFPSAGRKFFLQATPEVRARRRFNQLAEMGKPADFECLLASIKARDEADMNRSLAPLKPAEDATIIDTSHLDISEVRAAILAKI